MNYSHLMQLPIKSLNTAVKTVLSGEYPDSFRVQGKGITYKDAYFDFEVARVIKDFELRENSLLIQEEMIHIDQITDERMFFCIVFQKYVQAFILDKSFFKIFKDRVIPQYNKNYSQLDIYYWELETNCSLRITL